MTNNIRTRLVIGMALFSMICFWTPNVTAQEAGCYTQQYYTCGTRLTEASCVPDPTGARSTWWVSGVTLYYFPTGIAFQTQAPGWNYADFSRVQETVICSNIKRIDCFTTDDCSGTASDTWYNVDNPSNPTQFIAGEPSCYPPGWQH
jgi:hypothetical protein